MNKLLVLCYPTYANMLHLDSKGVAVVLAPDEMIRALVDLGVDVTVANMSPFDTDKPLMRSHLNLIAPSRINQAEYDVCWHMFRDPPQPEVLDSRAVNPNFFDGYKHIINPIMKMESMYKTDYIPILEKHGIGPAVIDKTGSLAGAEWSMCTHGAVVSSDHKMIRLPNYNNNRGDYPTREKEKGYITVEYLDSAVNGQRSFFRVGYSMGKTLSGWMYTSAADQLIQKTGTCKQKVAHEVPKEFHEAITAALSEIGVDVCHIEGLYINGKMKIFDINPYPTSYGNTLRPISEAAALEIARHFKWTK